MDIRALRNELADAWRKHGRRARELGFWSVANYRVGRFVAESDSALVRTVGSRCYGALALVLDLAAGLQVHREASIGPDLHIVHGWNIKIHPAAVLGARVGIMHDVTIGMETNDTSGAPVIGNDVFIGTGAKILGAVKIGDGARVGANSLVLTDVPPGATAVGVPARVLQYTGRKSPVPSPTPVISPTPVTAGEAAPLAAAPAH